MTDAPHRYRLSDTYQSHKQQLHRFLIARIEERSLDISTWEPQKLERFVAEQVRLFVVEQRLPVNQRESESLIADAVHELIGFGPL